ncbi:LysR family transcriptional regulator [Nisaea sp.]|uniref:LysR family transcriptional regulator n=1 Tax=Nisaea sp. TaxID=2024842 RepID=UPI0032EAE174
MRFTLDQLRAFLAVARTGNVRKAAEELHLTQPAVTARIKTLESALGVELFDRSAAMRPTRSGVALIGHAEQYLKLNSLIQRDVGHPEQVASMFRIGVSETIVQSWLPEFIAALRAEFPRLSIEIDVDISRNLRDRLLGNAIDLALLMGPVSDYRVENIPLPAYQMTWLRAPSLAVSDPARGAPVITFARDTRPFRLLKEALLERYGPSAVIFPSSSLSACFRLVAAGLGIGALPLSLAADYLLSGQVEQFDPGWSPAPLSFTASFLAAPEAAVSGRAAAIARQIAVEYDKNN